jgi:hypothetical protein
MITYVRINSPTKLANYLDRHADFAVRYYVSDYPTPDALIPLAKRSSARGWSVYIIDDLETPVRNSFDGHVNAWHLDLGDNDAV